jgi:hypothetical protein
VQWGSKSSQTDGIIALLQIEQPQRHEEGFDQGIQFVARISGEGNEAIDKGSFISEHVGQCNGAAKATRRTASLLCCRSSSHRDMKRDSMKASNLWQELVGTQ